MFTKRQKTAEKLSKNISQSNENHTENMFSQKKKELIFSNHGEKAPCIFRNIFLLLFYSPKWENETKWEKCLCENIKLYEFIVITSYWRRRNTDFYWFLFKHKSIFSETKKFFEDRRLSMPLKKKVTKKKFEILRECSADNASTNFPKSERETGKQRNNWFKHSAVTFSNSIFNRSKKKPFLPKENQTIIILLRTF